MRKCNIKFVYAYTKSYIGIWLLGFTLTIVAIVIQIKYSWLIQELIDNALLPKNFDLLKELCFKFFLLVIICSILSFLKELCFNYVSQKSIIKMRIDLFKHILKLPYEFFINMDDGEIVNRLVNDVRNTQDTFSDHIVTLLTSFFSSIFIVVWLLIVNWKLAILFLIIVPIFCVVTKGMWTVINKLSHETAENTGNLTGFFQEIISSIEIVKMTKNSYFINKLFQLCKKLSNSTIKLKMSDIFGNSLWECILTPYQAVIYLVGGYWYIQYNDPTIGTMLVFVNLVGILVPNVLSFINSISCMANGVASLDRIEKLFDICIEKGGIERLSLADEINIEFKNVSFRYKNTGFAIENINMSFSNNDFVTIVGHTGSGKSTILKLLVRLYDVDSGKININGISIKKYELTDLRSCFGFLQQDIYLIRGTLKENILLANEDASEEHINKVIQMVQLDRLIKRLPNALNTIIGERGASLSGGEKQRLSLARLLMNEQNKIIIMDEPTSALDLETEKQVLNDMISMLINRMTIVIDHRLVTLNFATKIVVMKEGRISEIGTYKELIREGGELYKLMNIHDKR